MKLFRYFTKATMGVHTAHIIVLLKQVMNVYLGKHPASGMGDNYVCMF